MTIHYSRKKMFKLLVFSWYSMFYLDLEDKDVKIGLKLGKYHFYTSSILGEKIDVKKIWNESKVYYRNIKKYNTKRMIKQFKDEVIVPINLNQININCNTFDEYWKIYKNKTF